MSSGVQPEFLDAQVDRAFTELEGHFNIADATDLDVVGLVFGPALERRAQESRKRSRSAEMSDLARRIAVLAQSQEEEPTPKAKKTAGPSRVTRANQGSSVAKKSQAEKEDADDESEPQRKRPRTGRMTTTVRQQPVTKPKRRRGEVPPQTDANGAVPEERDLDKVVSSATPIRDTLADSWSPQQCDRCRSLKLGPAECHLRKDLPKCDKCHHDRKGCTIGPSQGKGKGKARAKVIEESSPGEDEDEEMGENKPGKSHIPYLSSRTLTTVPCRLSCVAVGCDGCRQVRQALALPRECKLGRRDSRTFATASRRSSAQDRATFSRRCPGVRIGLPRRKAGVDRPGATVHSYTAPGAGLDASSHPGDQRGDRGEPGGGARDHEGRVGFRGLRA